MALAQVAYQISRDKDFAVRLRNDPEGTLAEKGFELSREELAFLTNGLFGDSEQVSLDKIVAKMRRNWK